MKQRQLLYIAIVVLSLLMLPVSALSQAENSGDTTNVTAEGYANKDTGACGTGSTHDTEKVKYSIRRILKFFNLEHPYQRCQNRIDIQNDILLKTPLEFKGLPGGTGTLLLQGNSSTLQLSQDFQGECAIIIGGASRITVRNLRINGAKIAAGKEVHGICVRTKGNVLENVEIGNMPGHGFYIEDADTTIKSVASNDEGLQHGRTIHSSAINNDGYGIYSPSANPIGDKLFVSADTIVVGNARTIEVEVPSGVIAPDYGPQIYAEKDKTGFEVSYSGTPSTGHYVTVQLSYNGAEEIGADASLLVYRLLPQQLDHDNVSSSTTDNSETEGAALGNSFVNEIYDIDLEDALIGTVHVNKDYVPASLEGFTSQFQSNPQPRLLSTGRASFKLPAGESLIYLRSVPFEETLTTSTMGISLQGFKEGQTLAYENGVLSVKEGSLSATTGSDALSGILGGGDSGAGSSGSGEGAGNLNVHEIKNWNDAFEKSGQVQQALREACMDDTNGLSGIPREPGLDSDKDGMDDDLESRDGECDPSTDLYTDPFDPDTDDDGIPDGQEDGYYRDGFVNAVVKRPGKKDYHILPTFIGFTNEEASAGAGLRCQIHLNQDFTVRGPMADEIPTSESDLDDRVSDANCEPLKRESFVGSISGTEAFYVDSSSLGGTFKGRDWNRLPSVVDVIREVITEQDVIQVLETDPTLEDSDGDGRGDGEELRDEYVDLLKSAYFYIDGNNKASNETCDEALAESHGSDLGIHWALAISPNSTVDNPKVVAVACKLSGIRSNNFKLKNKSEQQFNADNHSGWTDPRNPDTDGDGEDDESDPCPLIAKEDDPSCKRQCNNGWRAHQVQDAAGIDLAMLKSDRVSEYEAMYKKVKDLLIDLDMSSASKLTALGFRSTMDDDGIPDIVESGLQSKSAGFWNTKDCKDTVNQTAVDAYFTDLSFGSELKYPQVQVGTNANGTPIMEDVELDDSTDPCPGDPNKDECHEPGKAYANLEVPLIACFVDRDRDGLKDCQEDLNGDGEPDFEDGETDPLDPDTNGNGINDKDEVEALKRFAKHVEKEGLDVELGLPGLEAEDTDGDGLPDFVETGFDKTGTPHLYEPSDSAQRTCDEAFGVNGESLYDTNPFAADTDGDGKTDDQEIKCKTNPNNPDSDGDFLCDGDQDVIVNGVTICVAGESFDNNCEMATIIGVNMLAEAREESDPCKDDTDGDGNKDSTDRCKQDENIHCRSPRNNGADFDQDGLADDIEAITGTLPNNRDTDGDGLLDGCKFDLNTGQPIMNSGELCNQVLNDDYSPNYNEYDECGTTAPYESCDTDPRIGGADTDGDGLSDNLERLAGTNPTVKDTDGDCISDFDEGIITKVDAFGNETIESASDGVFPPCQEQMHPGTGLVYKVCQELDPLNSDTDGDGICDGLCGGRGENITCDGLRNIKILNGVTIRTQLDPRNGDTSGDGRPDSEAAWDSNGLFNVAAGIAPYTGCTLVNAQAQQAQRGSSLWLSLLMLLPLAVWRRRVGDYS